MGHPHKTEGCPTHPSEIKPKRNSSSLATRHVVIHDIALPALPRALRNSVIIRSPIWQSDVALSAKEGGKVENIRTEATNKDLTCHWKKPEQ